MHYLEFFKVTRNNVSRLNSSVCNVYTYKPVLEVFRYNWLLHIRQCSTSFCSTL